MQKTNHNLTMGISLGMCFGIAVGGLLGQTLFDEWSFGSLYGCGIGMMLGVAVGTAMDNRANSRMRECIIQEIVPQGEGYTVTLHNAAGEQLTATLSAADMEEADYHAGDRVLLAEEGKISPIPNGEE